MRRHSEIIVQKRTFEAYRNKGFVLVHEPLLTGSYVDGRVPSASHAAASANPSTSSSATTAFAVVIESLKELQEYHHPNYVYRLDLRRAYNVKTYTVALSICGEPSEPLKTPNDLLDMRAFNFLVPFDERALVKQYAAVSPWKQPGAVTMRFDCLFAAPEASGFITTADELTMKALHDFHNDTHFAYWYTTKTQDEKHKATWSRIFSKPVHQYIGVLTPPAPTLLSYATSIGIKVLVRRGWHYHLIV